VGAQDGAGVEQPVELAVGGRRDPLPDRPLRTGVVLGLDGEEAPDDVRGRIERLA
jgi:hypothetical protein